MDVSKLMRLSIEQRTSFLERLAHLQELETAPGARHEGKLLAAMLAEGKFSDATRFGFDELPTTLWAHYLKAPLALIKLLELFHPNLLRLDRPLRVLYLGAGQSEVLDEGRWLALAWKLRAVSRHLPDVTAIGPELAGAADWEPSEWRSMVEPLPPVITMIPGTLKQALGPMAGPPDWDRLFDVVVMHQPGFVGHFMDWWEDVAWADLAAAAKVPIIGTSYDAVDLAFDEKGLAASGRVVDSVYWNPVAHIYPDSGVAGQNPHQTRLQWGGVLWSTVPDAGAAQGFTWHQRSALDWFKEHLLGLLQDGPGLTGLQRWHRTCPMQLDDVHQYLMVSDDIRIDTRTGQVEAFGQRVAPGPVALEVLAEPGWEQRFRRTKDLLVELEGQLDMEAAIQARRQLGPMPPEPTSIMGSDDGDQEDGPHLYDIDEGEEGDAELDAFLEAMTAEEFEAFMLDVQSVIAQIKRLA